jgi:hypothetical protein
MAKPVYYNTSHRAYHGNQTVPADPHRQFASSDPYNEMGSGAQQPYNGPPGGYVQNPYPPQPQGYMPPQNHRYVPPGQQRGYPPQPGPPPPDQGYDNRGYNQDPAYPPQGQQRDPREQRAPSRSGAASAQSKFAIF